MLNFLELRKAEVRGTLLKGSSVKWSSAPPRSWWRKMFGALGEAVISGRTICILT